MHFPCPRLVGGIVIRRRVRSVYWRTRHVTMRPSGLQYLCLSKLDLNIWLEYVLDEPVKIRVATICVSKLSGFESDIKLQSPSVHMNFCPNEFTCRHVSCVGRIQICCLHG